jgi:hypothetical protein
MYLCEGTIPLGCAEPSVLHVHLHSSDNRESGGERLLLFSLLFFGGGGRLFRDAISI